MEGTAFTVGPSLGVGGPRPRRGWTQGEPPSQPSGTDDEGVIEPQAET